MLFSIYIVHIVYFSFELECEKNENKPKEAGIGPFLKNNWFKIFQGGGIYTEDMYLDYCITPTITVGKNCLGHLKNRNKNHI